MFIGISIIKVITKTKKPEQFSRVLVIFKASWQFMAEINKYKNKGKLFLQYGSKENHS